MKTSTVLSALTGLITATQAQFFSAIALRSASPIHFLPLTASGERLRLGGNTAAYCPDSVASLGGCPPGNYTNFAGGNGYLSMGAVVPGGQDVFIDPTCGAVQYTQAHSGVMPAGAIVDGWSRDNSSLQLLSWKDGLVACQSADTGVWDVYAAVPGLAIPDGCLGFDLATSNETSAAAWQYT